jgi:DNA-binding Xre family transcriptional regulator
MTVRNRITELLKERGHTAYKFWQVTGLARATAYRLAAEQDYIPTGDILNKVCKHYGVQPGDILYYVPDQPDQ